jgi:eukaryotic-like serine/threonine-protein kinase
MLQDLTSAWQASVAADQDFVAWAQDESRGCVPDQSDPNLQAATNPDLQATSYKTAFLRRWNPLATEYGLTTYQQNEL